MYTNYIVGYKGVWLEGERMKKIAVVLFVLGVGCIGMYFVMGSKFENVKVLFNSNGGTAVSEQILKKGDTASEPTPPVKENANFIEWQLNGQKYDFTKPVNNNILLDAIWNETVFHTVTLTIEEKQYTESIKDGGIVTIEGFNVPSKDGYKLVLYKEDGEAYILTSPVTVDLSLTGKYEEIKKYKVTFDSNGGSKVEAKEVISGEKITEEVTTRTGYNFDGWYLGSEKYDFNTPITDNIKLKAKWKEKDKINVIFMVDSKVYKTIPVKEETKVSKPDNPTKKGYKFVEWQLDGTKFDFNTKITEETTLIALFEEATTVTIKFDSDGGTSVNSQEIDSGSKVKKPTNPTKKDYKFVEWQLNGKTFDFNKVVEEDITLKAKWEKLVKYTVKFDSNGGGAAADQEVIAGEKAKAPNVTRSGHSLDGWVYENKIFDFNTPITMDITLTARWSKLNPDIIDDTNSSDSPNEGNE